MIKWWAKWAYGVQLNRAVFNLVFTLKEQYRVHRQDTFTTLQLAGMTRTSQRQTEKNLRLASKMGLLKYEPIGNGMRLKITLTLS